MLLNAREVIEEYCKISALVYHSIGDYTHASDGFCTKCPNSYNSTFFRNEGLVIEYIREATLQRLKADGYMIHQAFDPNTGRYLEDHDQEEV